MRRLQDLVQYQSSTCQHLLALAALRRHWHHLCEENTLRKVRHLFSSWLARCLWLLCSQEQASA